MGGGGRGCWVRFLLSSHCNRPSSKTEGTFVTPMRDFDVRSPRKSAGRNQTNHLLQDHRRSQDGDSFCFKSWPENLEPSSAARTQIFRGNLSLPDSGWPRFVRMFDLSSAQGVGVATACSRSGPSWNRKRIFGPKTKGNLVSCPSEGKRPPVA